MSAILSALPKVWTRDRDVTFECSLNDRDTLWEMLWFTFLVFKMGENNSAYLVEIKWIKIFMNA